MGYNIYQQLPKLKEQLKNEGFEKDIPIDVFWSTMMRTFGMNRATAKKWIIDFSYTKMISVVDRNKDISPLKDEVVNFL